MIPDERKQHSDYYHEGPEEVKHDMGLTFYNTRMSFSLKRYAMLTASLEIVDLVVPLSICNKTP